MIEVTQEKAAALANYIRRSSKTTSECNVTSPRWSSSKKMKRAAREAVKTRRETPLQVEKDGPETSRIYLQERRIRQAGIHWPCAKKTSDTRSLL
jgi:hypothetical protein